MGKIGEVAEENEMGEMDGYLSTPATPQISGDHLDCLGYSVAKGMKWGEAKRRK